MIWPLLTKNIACNRSQNFKSVEKRKKKTSLGVGCFGIWTVERRFIFLKNIIIVEVISKQISFSFKKIFWLIRSLSFVHCISWKVSRWFGWKEGLLHPSFIDDWWKKLKNRGDRTFLSAMRIGFWNSNGTFSEILSSIFFLVCFFKLKNNASSDFHCSKIMLQQPV